MNREEIKKNKKRTRIIDLIVTLVFLVAISFTAYFGYNVYKEQMDLYKSEQEAKHLSLQHTTKIETELTNEEPKKVPEIKVDLKEVEKEVPDARLWIHIPYIQLSEVVAQTTDNDYYLTHSPNKDWSALGTLFLDSQNHSNLEDNYVSYIFGHKSEKVSVRFSGLDSLFTEEGKQQTFYLHQDNKQYTYKILDSFYENPISDLYPKGLFKAEDSEQFKEALVKAGLNQEIVDTITKDKKYTILVTCKEYWDDSQRRLVLGELIETIPYE